MNGAGIFLKNELISLSKTLNKRVQVRSDVLNDETADKIFLVTLILITGFTH